MTVVFLNPSAELGGAERALIDVVASIRARSPETEMALIAAGEGPLLKAAVDLGMRVTALPFDRRVAEVGDTALLGADRRAFAAFARRMVGASGAAVGYASRLRAAIRSYRPSVIHSNGAKMHLLGAAVRDHAPLVWHIHDFIGDRRVVSRAMRALSWRARAAIANSRAVAEDARRLFPHLPTTVVYNACDTDRFNPSGVAADLDALAGRAASGASRPPVRIGLVATYARWKGQDVFLDAARRAIAAGAPPVRFYVVGGPIYETQASQFRRDELEAMARELGLADDVVFVPFQGRIEEVYRALDVVVHASTRPEPFGLTIVEAMASGRAVVVSAAGGAAELFEDGTDALGVPPRDAEGLAHVIATLARDAPRRSELGAAARRSALRRFSRTRLADQVLAVYADVTGSSRHGRFLDGARSAR
jgi:glycosyltransferase involved in cell wall biosynthesis